MRGLQVSLHEICRPQLMPVCITATLRLVKCLKTCVPALYEAPRIQHNPHRSGKLSDPWNYALLACNPPWRYRYACPPPIPVLPVEVKTWSRGHVFSWGRGVIVPCARPERSNS